MQIRTLNETVGNLNKQVHGLTDQLNDSVEKSKSCRTEKDKMTNYVSIIIRNA